MKKILLILLLALVGLFSFVSLNDKWTNNPQSNIEEEIEVPNEEAEKDELEEEEKVRATILAVGDVMFHVPQVKAAYDSNTQTYDFSDVFRHVKKYIESADIAIANFESVVYGNEIGFSGYPRFNSPVETLSALKDSGFDILNTGNNHTLDQGKQGIINTIDHIQEHGMKNVGTYKSPGENILIEEVNEIKIAFLSYCYGYNGLENLLTEEEKSYMISKIDEEKIKNDIIKAKSMEADLISVIIHWGNEYERNPSPYQLELGRKMVEWGANIIFGSHPHVIQKSEMIEYEGKNNFIIYSMGNFLSNQRESTMGNKYAEDGVIVNVHVEKDLVTGDTIITDIDYIPTWVRRYEEGNKRKFEIIPVEEFLKDDELIMTLNQKERIRIDESFQSTMEVMSEY